MERKDFRPVIKHYYLKGLKPKEIKAELDEVHGSCAPSYATIYNWLSKFKRGLTSTNDGHRSGRPVEASSSVMVEKIHDMVLSDQQITVRELVEATGISQGTVFSILHEKLGVEKIATKWVPRLLSVEDDRNRLVDSEVGLTLFRRNPNEFVRRSMSDSETWRQYCTQEKKEQLKQSAKNDDQKGKGNAIHCRQYKARKKTEAAESQPLSSLPTTVTAKLGSEIVNPTPKRKAERCKQYRALKKMAGEQSQSYVSLSTEKSYAKCARLNSPLKAAQSCPDITVNNTKQSSAEQPQKPLQVGNEQADEHSRNVDFNQAQNASPSSMDQGYLNISGPMVQRVVKMSSAGSVPAVINSSAVSQIPMMSYVSTPKAAVNQPQTSCQIAPKYPIAVNIPTTHLTTTAAAAACESPSTTAAAVATSSEESRTVVLDPAKINEKLFPSLLVSLKPCLQSKEFTSSVCTELRSELDKELKKVLHLLPSELIEWLIQQGLIRVEQKCHTHLDSMFQPIPFKLGVYSDSSKFANSGGYVWVSDCCGQRHVSVFSGSLFEGFSQTPKTLLKLIYHWACQTSPANVSQWLQVDMNSIQSFHASMRAISTCVVHEKLRGLGGWQREVEVALMTLSSYTNVWISKQVEILGVLDQEKNIVRLLAVEPAKRTPGTPTSVKRDYHHILAPLVIWVDKESIIVTDLSIDQNCLHDLGFQNVQQTSPNAPSGRNLKIVEYLSTSIPRSFQNVLGMLNRVTIQQFLDEISWREKFGPSPMQAFKNLLAHIAELTKLELDQTMSALLNRISSDPFQCWEYKSVCKKPGVLPSPNPMHDAVPLLTSEEDTPPLKKNCKRPAEPEVPTTSSTIFEIPKKLRQQTVLQSYYYGRVKGRSKKELKKEQLELMASAGNNTPAEFQCCVCRQTFRNNLQFMRHLMKHTQNNGNLDVADDTSVCNYCLCTFITPSMLKSHIKDAHIFNEGQFPCRICNIEFFSTVKLIEHMHSLHVQLELPYSCKVCGYRSSMHQDVVNHFHELHGGSLKLLCAFCLQVVTLSGRRELDMDDVFLFFQHIKKHVMQSPTIQCGKCILRFTTEENLLEHLDRDHGSWKGKPGLTRFQFKGENIVMYVPEPVSMLAGRSITIIKKPLEIISNSSTTTIRSSGMPTGSNLKPNMYKSKFTGVEYSPQFGLLQEEIKIKKNERAINLKCYECNNSIYQERHFMTNLSCTQCRYTTCCSEAMRTHLSKFHHIVNSIGQKISADIKLGIIEEGAVSVPMYCICGFGDISGNTLATHLVQSECQTAYATVKGTKELERPSASLLPLATVDDQSDQNPSDQMMKAYAERMAQTSVASHWQSQDFSPTTYENCDKLKKQLL